MVYVETTITIGLLVVMWGGKIFPENFQYFFNYLIVDNKNNNVS